MNLTEKFLSFALLGAEWVMWLLIALSVLSVAVMVERVIYYNARRVDMDKLAALVKRALSGGEREAVIKQLADAQSMEAIVAREGLRESERGPGAAGEAMQGARGRERLKHEKNLAFLGTIGNNAPVVGLFGTVIGIVGAFDSLSDKTGAGKENTGKIMSLISEALVATAIGLLVALPAVAAYNYFQRRVRANAAGADSIAHTILGELKAEDKGAKG